MTGLVVPSTIAYRHQRLGQPRGWKLPGQCTCPERDIQNREGMDVLRAPMRLGARLGGMGKISELLLNIVIKLPTQGAEWVDMRESYAAVPSAYMAPVPSGEKAGPNPLLSSMWNRVSLYSCC
jgi:hypothetical protein